MSNGMIDPHIDVCVICAIPVEAQAFLDVLEKERAGSIQSGFSNTGFEYKYKTITNNAGESLTVQVSWLPRYGPTATTMHVSEFVREFSPRFVAMTGICAGDRQEVQKGDLIVAERAFAYDTGKFVKGEDGMLQQLYDTDTVGPSNRIVQYARMFGGWKTAFARVKRPSTARALPECYIAPLASGNAVRADNPFEQIRVPVRKALAIDMEGEAFYRTLEDFPHIRSLIVKGVSDYADGTKDDSYHEYAATASTLYMLAFIKQYVTNQLMPGNARPTPPTPSPEASTPVTVVGTPAKADNALSPQSEQQAAKKPSGALSILFIYAPEDKEFYQGIEKQLVMMRRLGMINIQDMQNVLAGDLKRQSAQQSLCEADIILLLMSPALFTSDDLFEQQLEPAWQQIARGARVIPVLAKPITSFEKTKYYAIQPLPINGKPIIRWSTREDAYYAIAEGLQKLIKDWNKPAK